MSDETRNSEDDAYEEARQAELESRYPRPLSAAGDMVFKQATDPDRSWFEQTFPGHATYLEAYKMAADLLFREVERNRADVEATGAIDVSHWLVYPIYFTYRHAIELSLKQMREARATDWGLTVEPFIGHGLVALWKEVEDWIRDICGTSLRTEADAFGQLVEEIQRIDPKGDAGRYDLRTNRQPSFDGIRPLDLKNLRDSCEKMLNFLTWIWSLREEKRQVDEERAQWLDELRGDF
jgi:hypothetical protein